MIRELVKLAGPGITLLGVGLSVVGTYRMTRAYHAYDGKGFAKSVVRAVSLATASATATVDTEAATTTRIGSLNPERREESLVGIYQVFSGFALQFAGTLFSLVDIAWDIVQHKSS